MDDDAMTELADRVLRAWTAQDIDRVLDCYTEDLRYRDPNTRGPVCGREAMRRYLMTLFASWDMTWHRRHLYRFADGGGCALTWRASFQRVGSTMRIDVSGMDIVVLRRQSIAINEVYYDRSVLVAVELEASFARTSSIRGGK